MTQPSDEQTPHSVGNDPFLLLYPQRPELGMLSTLARQSRFPEIQQYETEKISRIWRVRAVISDHTPLVGNPNELFARPPFNLLFVENNTVALYLHWGGRHAVYFDFVADKDKRLKYLEIGVECKLPATAPILALRSFNAFLDVFAVTYSLPLAIQRVEVISPVDQEVLICQTLLPAKDGIIVEDSGGGYIQAELFAPYDAIYREALISSSPFYRLLCGARMYEGTNTLRKQIKDLCTQRNINSKLPSDPPIDKEHLLKLGFTDDFCSNVRFAQDLFHRLKDMRNAIAHFLIEKDGENLHVYLADGPDFRRYSIAAAALLHYARVALQGLRSFHDRELGRIRQSTIVPMLHQRDQFIVRASDIGLE